MPHFAVVGEGIDRGSPEPNEIEITLNVVTCRETALQRRSSDRFVDYV